MSRALAPLGLLALVGAVVAALLIESPIVLLALLGPPTLVLLGHARGRGLLARRLLAVAPFAALAVGARWLGAAAPPALGVPGLGVQGLGVQGLGVQGLAVQGLAVQGLGVQGLAVQGLAVLGFAVPALRIAIAVAWSTWLGVAFTPAALDAALGRLGVPAALVELLAQTRRFSAQLAETVGAAWSAATLRGGLTSPRTTAQTAGWVAGVVVVRAFDRSERVALAAALRGAELGSPAPDEAVLGAPAVGGQAHEREAARVGGGRGEARQVRALGVQPVADPELARVEARGDR